MRERERRVGIYRKGLQELPVVVTGFEFENFITSVKLIAVRSD